MNGIDKWADDMLRTPSTGPTPQELLDERTLAEIRCRAVRVVAARSADAAECRELLGALGLSTADVRAARQVARKPANRKRTTRKAVTRKPAADRGADVVRGAPAA